jgi:hypothetical protein
VSGKASRNAAIALLGRLINTRVANSDLDIKPGLRALPLHKGREGAKKFANLLSDMAISVGLSITSLCRTNEPRLSPRKGRI